MTELSYTISDIQTRIFEIQELRHKSQSSGDNAGTTTIIDQSLMSLDERLESVSKGMKSVNELLDPLLQNSSTPTFSQNGESNENALMLRKHATLLSEWEAVQDESEVLREELKEDKWLTVFRTVTDQADGMMSSLEKGVNRCQEFIWQVHRRGVDEFSLAQSQSSLHNSRNDRPPPTLEVFNSLLESFEAKKKHYMPATSKVLSIIDKGVRDRVTKNGETLRRHAESAQRWRNLKERISRTEAEMETVGKILLNGDTLSENGSSTSTHPNGYLMTPPSGGRTSRAPSSASTISRSMSPFRKLARKITGTTKSPITPVTPLNVTKNNRTPSSEPVVRRQKTSLFSTFRGTTPTTPERPSHKYSQSFTPEPSPRGAEKNRPSLANKQRWNGSTKIDPEATVKATTPKRAPSAAGSYSDIPPVPSNTFRRSISRASLASSRPWSPLTSTGSTNNSTSQSKPPIPNFRPPSRARTPSFARSQTPARSFTPGPVPPTPTPRARPKTPSAIPIPARPKADVDEGYGSPQRAFSPAFSTVSAASGFGHPPRPPSRSMIPVPAVHLSSPSRPSSSLSSYSRAESPSAFKHFAARAQTPESALRAKVQQMPIYQGTVVNRTARPSLTKLPPSSFKENASRTPSRPVSRNGAYTPTMDGMAMHEYVPENPKDPLDNEVASIVNSIAHGLLVERIDPPLRKVPKEGEEIKAQYAFSNALSRKVVTCKLTTLTRLAKGGPDTTTKKVMCRVGGGWQDLSHYVLNRQAGM
ncbi:hypothetical protein C8J56DRAFT_799411 [Mycena floridula]|nr:hypothetical protein C8J56DRAFT_799411 [Mycena floridula]